MTRVIFILTWMTAALLSTGCDDSPPGTDNEVDAECRGSDCLPGSPDIGPDATDNPPMRDRGIPVADGGDAGVVSTPDGSLDMGDQGLVPDATPRPEACQPIPAEPLSSGLARATRIGQIPAGGPLNADQLWVGDLDGDPGNQAEILIVRGGRVEALGLDGRPWWRSEVLAVTRLAGVADLDGDGRREVVAVAPRSIHIFDGLSGHNRWSLPDDAFDTDGIVSVSRVFLADVTGEEIPDLYVTDGGCGDEGTGRGAFFSFSGPEFGTRVSTIAGSRFNGRCGRWQTTADIDQDGLPELLVTDGRGLNAFDPRTGQHLACGTIDDAPPNGPLPTLAVAGGRGGWFTFLANRIIHIRVQLDASRICPTERVFVNQFETAAVDRLRPHGSGAVSLPAIGDPGILTSVWDETNDRWSIMAYGPRGQAMVADDAALLHVQTLMDGGYRLLVRRTPDRSAGVHSGRCGTILLGANGQPTPGLDLGVCEPVSGPPALDRTGEFTAPLSVALENGDHLILRHWRDGEDAADTPSELLFLGQDVRRFNGGSDGVSSVVSAGRTGVSRDGESTLAAAFTTIDGRIGLLSDALALTQTEPGTAQPPLRRAVGAPKILALRVDGRPHLLSTTSAGLLSLIDPDPAQSRAVWETHLGRPQRGDHSMDHGRSADGDGWVVTRWPGGGEAAIAVRTVADGVVQWTHTPAEETTRTMRVVRVAKDGAGVARSVIRYDRQGVEAPVTPDPTCEREVAVGEPRFEPDPACPRLPIFRRFVTALAPEDGRCLWRAVIEPTTPCSGPSNQTLSVVGDRIFVTESTGLVMLNVADGSLVGRAELGLIQGAVGRGGGEVIAGAEGTAFVRAQGNGPPEGYSAALELRWRASEIPTLRNQSWIRREAVVLGGTLWTTPGAGWPIYRYDVGSGDRLPFIALRDGALQEDPVAEARYANVLDLLAITDIDGTGQGGVMVITDEGIMYGVHIDGRLAWSRRFDASLGRPALMNSIPESPLLMAVPMGRGQIDIFGPPGPTPTPLVWDLACPLGMACNDADDIDESINAEAVCGQWTPVDGIDGYVFRIIGTGGVPRTEWQNTGGESRFSLAVEDLPLGSRYRIQVRTYVEDGDERRYSEPTTSDGVDLINISSPVVDLRADPMQIPSGGGDVSFVATAQDDDLLAGWRLDIVNGDTGEYVRRIGGGPLAQPMLDAGALWFGQDRFEVPVDAGLYRAELSVVDRTGNEGSADVEILVCDGPCP